MKLLLNKMLLHMRKESGISQRELAKRIKSSEAVISRAENQHCSMKFLQRVADELGYTIEVGLKAGNENEITRDV